MLRGLVTGATFQCHDARRLARALQYDPHWSEQGMSTITGMVQVEGNTYRIVRVTPGRYEAVRISDNQRVGTFSSQPPVRLAPEACDERLLLEIAHTALRRARTSWGGRLV